MKLFANNNYNKHLRENANSLRKNMTKSEACLWKYALRANNMMSYSFRHQRPIGPYIVDFVCLELMLVIALDGITHILEETQTKDRTKEKYLQDQGFIIMRFADKEVLTKMNEAIGKIKFVIKWIEQNKK